MNGIARKDVPASVWHYTTAAGLISILETRTFWASSAAMMNDRQEILHGRQLLAAAVERRRESFTERQRRLIDWFGLGGDGDPENVFIFSTSEFGDSLGLWRSYGAGTTAEYAIEIDTTFALNPVMQEGPERPGPPENDDEIDRSMISGGHWRKVDYVKEADFESSADHILKEIIREIDKSADDAGHRVPFLPYLTGAPDVTMGIKHEGFEEEMEVRAVWTTTDWERYVKYRAGRFGVTPYIALSGGSQRGGSTSWAMPKEFIEPGPTPELPLLPIKSIRVGPTRAVDHSKRALENLLKLHCYRNVQVHTSATPFR